MKFVIIASLICMMMGCKPAEDDTQSTQLTLHEGDVVASRNAEGWSVMKILKIDEESSILHVTLYHSVDVKPTLEDVREMQPFVMHVPLALTPENTEGVLIGNVPITEADLEGYRWYEEEMQRASTVTDSTGSKATGRP
ncbi:MAG: hypothetical protein JSS89_05335 [Bacteroidetes bacterium]|nr:hypothetical protein [Bacteroidota bacterium]